MNQFECIRRSEHRSTGEQVIEDGTDTVKIRAVVDRAIHTPCLFGRHVMRRSTHQFGDAELVAFLSDERRQPKVDDPDVLGPSVHEDVAGGDVVVDDAGSVDLPHSDDKQLPSANAQHPRTL